MNVTIINELFSTGSMKKKAISANTAVCISGKTSEVHVAETQNVWNGFHV